jgi:hypothetical protein
MADLVVVGGGVVGVAESVVGSGHLVLVATLARKAERGIVLGPAPGHSGGRQARGRHGALDGRGGHVFPVALMISSFLRPVIVTYPPSSMAARSPVCSLPPGSVRDGAACGWRAKLR